jgi:hypothetical protein
VVWRVLGDDGGCAVKRQQGHRFSEICDVLVLGESISEI